MSKGSKPTHIAPLDPETRLRMNQSLGQEVQVLEVHAHVEEDYQALEHDKGLKRPRGETFHAPGSLQRAPFVTIAASCLTWKSSASSIP